jgi:hypothetical protein
MGKVLDAVTIPVDGTEPPAVTWCAGPEPGKNVRHRPARPPTPDHRPFAEKC